VDGGAGDGAIEQPLPLGHHGTAQGLPAAIEGAVAVAEVGAPAPAELRRYVGYSLVSSIGLTNAIWVIYLKERGLSLGEIGVAEAFFHLAPITLELPTGSLADVFGRKWSLAVGSLMAACSALLMLAVHDLWLALPAMYLGGASMTFASGAQQAFLYDALAERGGTDRFSKVFGRLISASFLVVGLTTWLGASLAELSFVWPYALTVGVGLLGAYLAATLREPERERAAHRSMGRTIVEALRIVRGRPRLAALLLFGAVFWTAVTLIELYAQAVLDGMGLATSAIGLLIGGSFVVVAAGAWVAHRVTARGGFRAWTVGLTLLTVGGALGLGSEALLLAVVTYVAFEFGTGLYEPILIDRVNRDLAAPQRATVLSVQGFLFSLTMVWAFPLVGWIAGRAGWLAAYGAVSAGLLAALVAWLAVETRARPANRI
jgi:MFS family permease